MNTQITFDKELKKEILGLLEKEVDKEGFIVEKNNPGQRVLAFDGTEITVDEFGGIQKGSTVFLKNDLVSLMRLVGGLNGIN